MRKLSMGHALQTLSLIALAAFLLGNSCPNNTSTPLEEADCTVALAGPEAPVETGSTVMIDLTLGSHWGEAAETLWTVEPATGLSWSGTGAGATATFYEPGTYTFTVSLEDAGGDDPCAGSSETFTVEVTGESIDCSAEIVGAVEIPVGDGNEFAILLGDAWSPTTEVDWTVLPADGADWLGDAGGLTVDFSVNGAFILGASCSDPVVGNPCQEVDVDLLVQVGEVDCAAGIQGQELVEQGNSAIYDLSLGGSWSAYRVVEWSASPPTPLAWNGDGTELTAAFPEPGTYTLSAAISDPMEGAHCDGVTVDLVVEVTAPDCAVQIVGPSMVSVGAQADFELVLGSGWPSLPNADWSVAPSGDVVFAGDGAGMTATFGAPGTYMVDVLVNDPEDGSPCDDAGDSIEVIVTEAGAGIQTGLFDSPFPQPDGITFADLPFWQEQAGVRHLLLISCERGIAAVDLATQQQVPAISRLSPEPLLEPPFGTVVLGPQSRQREAFMSLFTFDPVGAVMGNWDEAAGEWFLFSQFIEFQSGVFDGVRYGERDDALLYVPGNGRVMQVLWEDGPGFLATPRVDFGDLPGAPAISACGNSPVGALLFITSGFPGHAWLWHDDGRSFTATDLGEVGSTPRRIRTLNGIAVASSFGDGTISVFTWDGAGAAAKTATQVVGDGPVGVDLLARAGGGVYAITTGWNDNTYTITEIDAAGAVIVSETENLPGGAAQPAHGAWLHDEEESFAVSCYGSGHIFVERRAH